jgi:hypothetical protein
MLLVAPRASVAAIIPVLRRPEQALLEPSEVRTATHLALQHLAAVDVAFDWAMTPGQGDAGFAGVIVIADSLRTPLPGHERTLRRPGQPGIPRLRRPLAHERGHVLGASDGGGHLGMLGSPVGALGRLVLIRPLGSPSHPPGRPTGREVASCRLCRGRRCRGVWPGAWRRRWAERATVGELPVYPRPGSSRKRRTASRPPACHRSRRSGVSGVRRRRPRSVRRLRAGKVSIRPSR